MSLSPDQSKKLDGIFFPSRVAREQAVEKSGGRFVYYTSAAVAVKVLSKREVWLRNTNTMNDYRELEHGYQCLRISFNDEGRRKGFFDALDGVFPGITKEVIDLFDGWVPYIRSGTYAICVSEHGVDEDETGRLSMWRAYGGDAGVAMVLNGKVMFSESEVLGAHASPVAYMSPSRFAEEFVNITKSIKKNQVFLRGIERQTVKNTVFNLLRFAMTCTKHPGFHEEREWRVVATPQMYPSKHVKRHVETVHGKPQTVLKIELQNLPGEGLVGLALPELVNRIIIGPCEFPHVIKDAFVQLLSEAGVAGAGERVFISDIPLRRI